MKLAAQESKRARLLGAGAVVVALGLAAGLFLALGGSGGGTPRSAARPSQRSVIGLSEEGTVPGATGASPPAALVQQPCRLVTQVEAEAILGAAIGPPRQAVLGPSCVYADGPATISLSVESFSYSSIRGRLQTVEHFTVAGWPVYCASLGRPLLLAPVGPNSTLEVTAPCPIARGFAAAALPRLTNA